ncbi:uncharacterized protein Tco025E_07020 [Trypanosoma conorhini]|uniref:Uncharacterized protein n=1 Tax=Trypanosoma conorhini TaxID=83891 RepID=A0A3R7MWL7_9TRYP|nr:uncharacterized protein Tco025E_07020 [Trypanosoma conorhini]RNF09163.1 hypothetical protein Tco025E_07020 [Trypanosoma conorhini]
MNIYSRDQQIYNIQRTRGERWLLHLYTLSTGVQVVCFLFAIIRTANAASDSFENNFFVTSPLDLGPLRLWDNCSLSVSSSYTMFTNVSYSLSTRNVGYFVSRSVTNIRMLFTCAALNIVVCAINRLWVWLEIRELRYHFVVIRHDVFVVWELFLTIVGIVLLQPVANESEVLSKYFSYCAQKRPYGLGNVSRYVELYVSFFTALAVFSLAALAAVVVRCKKVPGDEEMEASAVQPHLPPQRLLSVYSAGEAGRRWQPPQQQLYNPPPHVGRNAGGQGDFRPSNDVAFHTAAAPVAPLVPPEDFERRHSAPSFGPSISRPMTPNTLGPDPGTLHHRGDAAVSARDGSSTGAGAQPLTRFQPPPPPPPPSLGRQRDTQGDAATEATVELENQR